MCGFFGIFSYNKDIREYIETEKVSGLFQHRGPDDSGTFISQDRRVFLSHNRLAVIDPSPSGHQPMKNNDGKVWAVFNGEIYNFVSLRKELEKLNKKFISNSDTEVLIKGYEAWGIEGLLKKIRGMVSFAIYDNRLDEDKIILARGALGIKPLYYSIDGQKVCFSSEINPLINLSLVKNEIDESSSLEFLEKGYISPPRTIYADVSALEMGAFLTITSKGIEKKHHSNLLEYFSKDTINLSWDKAVDNLRSSFHDSLQAHMVSDVEVGVFLSGGVDSSALVAGMSHLGHKKIKTLTVVFSEKEYNEAYYAGIVSKTFNTEHLEVKISEKDLLEKSSHIFKHMDQPTVDGVNTYFVSLAAKKMGLKVALSGLGADELFGGYDSFRNIAFLEFIIKRMGFLRNFLPDNLAATAHIKKMKELMGLNKKDFTDIYFSYRSLFGKEQINRIFPRSSSIQKIKNSAIQTGVGSIKDPFKRVSFLEFNHYMAGQLLRDVDVFSMANSIEARVPYVDTEFLKSVNEIPSKYKMTNPKKRLLIEAIRSLPKEIINRPKQGFVFPFAVWLKGDFGELIKEGLYKKDIYDKKELKKLMQDFYSNKLHWSRIWALYVLSRFYA